MHTSLVLKNEGPGEAEIQEVEEDPEFLKIEVEGGVQEKIPVEIGLAVEAQGATSTRNLI